MKDIKLRKRIGNFIATLIIIFSVITFVISINEIFSWKNDADKVNDLTNEINEVVSVVTTNDSDTTEIIEPDIEIDEFNPYFNYIKMNLIEVDFNKLIDINNDTKGWIQVNGTNINYPFVQSKDNEYYLNHAIDKSYNEAGWVFMDYRNDIKSMDKNTILYAHGRFDNTMFGSLLNIFNNGWLNDSDNFVIKMSSEYENTLWQIFSAYIIPTTNDYLQIDFSDDIEFLNFLKMLTKRSDYNFNTSVSGSDKILTLSTCFNNNDKLVLHAKLIKKEDRN